MELKRIEKQTIPGRTTRIILKAYARVLGANDWNGILNLADLGFLIDKQDPGLLHDKFNYSDFVSVHLAIEQIYGSQGERGVTLQAGKEAFQIIVNNYGFISWLAGLVILLIPMRPRINYGINALGKRFSKIFQQPVIVKEEKDHFLWIIRRCPVCWERKGAERPVCHFITGFLQAFVNWISHGRVYRVNEVKCCASDDPVCEFLILTDPIPA